MFLTAVLASLQEAGLTITTDGRVLRVTPQQLITDTIRKAIRTNKADLIRGLAPVPVFESDDPTWSRRLWCRLYRHRFGWRDTSGVVHCLTCCRPALSSPVSRILESADGDITERDPFAALSGDGDLLESQRMAIINQLAMHHKEGP